MHKADALRSCLSVANTKFSRVSLFAALVVLPLSCTSDIRTDVTDCVKRDESQCRLGESVRVVAFWATNAPPSAESSLVPWPEAELLLGIAPRALADRMASATGLGPVVERLDIGCGPFVGLLLRRPGVRLSYPPIPVDDVPDLTGIEVAASLSNRSHVRLRCLFPLYGRTVADVDRAWRTYNTGLAMERLGLPVATGTAALLVHPGESRAIDYSAVRTSAVSGVWPVPSVIAARPAQDATGGPLPAGARASFVTFVLTSPPGAVLDSVRVPAPPWTK